MCSVVYIYTVYIYTIVFSHKDAYLLHLYEIYSKFITNSFNIFYVEQLK